MQLPPKSQGLPLYLIRHLDGTGGRIQTYESGSQSPLPYRLATPVYLCTSPLNPDSPQRTSNSFLRPTGHGLFYLSFCYHYEVHERRNFSCLYERNKRLSGVRGGSRTPICGTGGHRFQPLNYSHISDFHLFLISTDVLSISHSVSFVKSF